MSDPLAPFVQSPSLSEARIARQWKNVDPRSLPSRWRRSRAPWAVALACFVALVALLVRNRAVASHDALEGTVIDSDAVTLPDGSRIAVANGAHVQVLAVQPDAIELGLDRGSVDLSVPHAQRTLVIHTPRYDVVDLGTRFGVTVDGEGHLGVQVAEGSVEVRDRKGVETPRRLVAGDSWSNVPSGAPSPITAPAPAPSEPAAVPSSAESGPAEAPAASAHEDTSPKGLLEAAERARLRGQPRAAATALDTLRRRFRSDPRAALAAFELGRLRLDSLGDAPGAVEALGDAIALAPRGPLREDAESRRVEALAAERSPECPAARASFLARYPGSAHAAVVNGQCAGE